MIVRTVYENLKITIPNVAHTLDGFRSWAVSDQFPDRGQVSFFNGELVIDMSPEKVESHNKVKAEIDRVIGSLVKAHDIRRQFRLVRQRDRVGGWQYTLETR